MNDNTISLGINTKSLIPYNVLIIDDSRMDQLLLRQFLQSEMFHISHMAETGKEALDYLNLNASRIDVVCVDYDMPGINGVETIRQIKHFYPHMLIVMITAHPNKEVVSELHKMSVNAMIVKPINKTQVTEKFAMVLGRKDVLSKSVVAYKKNTGIDLNDLKIPPQPSVLIKVLQFDTSTSGGSTELEKIIAPDKAISLDILRISNSAFYGRAGTITSLKDAITLLGVKTIKNLVILQSKKHFSSSLVGQMFKTHINDLPILTSLVSFDLLNPLGQMKLQNDIFTFALFRKIGSTVLAMNFPKRYQEVLKLCEIGTKSQIAIEKEEFNLSSIDVGLKVFRIWNMPKPFHDHIKNINFNAQMISEVDDKDRLTRLAENLSKKMMKIQISREEEDIMNVIFDYYKASDEIRNAFSEEYMENMKDHPYFL
ncbi:MAG: HDOD domain-containing protein [Leptospiraceae bacterium]|nr:HDOD domain-containing protein [Leptospiraceae bacterium]MCP5512296.1 HDOD domain-containing protein [Leptospiraceae bacterium]